MSIKWSTCSSLHLADCLTSVVGPGPDRLVSNNEAGQKMLGDKPNSSYGVLKLSLEFL